MSFQDQITRLVLDVATNRLIYFTKDLNEKLVVESTICLYDYSKLLPADCTLSNCWNFRLVGQDLINSPENNTVKNQEDIFNFNKQQFIDQINDKINKLRNQYDEDKFLDLKCQEFNQEKKPLLEAYSNGKGISIDLAIAELSDKKNTRDKIVIETEYLKNMYIHRVQKLKSNEQLMNTRDTFMNRNLATRKSFDSEVIRVIENQIDLNWMMDILNENTDDWLLDTKRQEVNIYQKDTESINLISLESEPGLKNILNTTTCRYSPHSGKYQKILEFLHNFAKKQNAQLYKTAIVKLKPGGLVLKHEDYGWFYYNTDRYHLVLQGNYFYMVEEDNWIEATPGMIFWFNNKIPHHSYNIGSEPRISIIFDLLPYNQIDLRSKNDRDLVKKRLINDIDVKEKNKQYNLDKWFEDNSGFDPALTYHLKRSN